MSEFKGTPGPWHVVETKCNHGASSWFEICAEDAVIGEIFRNENDTNPPELTITGEDQAANAQLIASAPALLGALAPFAVAADECEGAPDDMEIGDASYEKVTVAHCRAARAAIKSATEAGK